MRDLKCIFVPPHPPSSSGPRHVSDTSVAFSSARGNRQLQEDYESLKKYVLFCKNVLDVL